MPSPEPPSDLPRSAADQPAAIPVARPLWSPRHVPPPPWILRGSALIVVGRVARAIARQIADSRFAPSPHHYPLSLPFLGSLAAVAFVQYDVSPVGPYHEMMVSPGIIWHTVPGALIARLPVDNQRSLLGGRAIWGLPKTMADFTWTAGNAPSVEVREPTGTPLIQARFQRRGSWPALPLPPLPIMSACGPRLQVFTVTPLLRSVTRMRVEFEIPDKSDFVPLRNLLRGPHLALHVEMLRLRVSTPLDLL